jgi:hypothetical protein
LLSTSANEISDARAASTVGDASRGRLPVGTTETSPMQSAPAATSTAHLLTGVVMLM